MSKELLVRWKTHTYIQLNGVNCKRAPGDEDLLDWHLAQSCARTGMVRILTDVSLSDRMLDKDCALVLPEED